MPDVTKTIPQFPTPHMKACKRAVERSMHQEVKKEKVGFRIKKAVNIAFYALSVTLATIGSLLLIGMWIIPAISIAATKVVALVSFVALAVLLTIKIWQWIEPFMPNFIRVPLNYVQSLICGLVSSLALAILWPVNLVKRNPTKEQCDSTQTPILMIHGFLGSSNNWIYHKYRLKEAGHKNLFTINLGNHFGSLEKSAAKVREMVKVIRERTGRDDIIFLCHSRGGLVARQYHQSYSKKQGINVKEIITMGTPLRGTVVAKLTFGLFRSCKEMYPRSPALQDQEKFADANIETRYFHLASKCDYIIQPVKNATPSRVLHNCKIEWLHGTGHVSYLFSDAAADAIVNRLRCYREQIKGAAAAA